MQGPSPRFSSLEHLIYDQYPKKCFTQIHRDLYGDGVHPDGHQHSGNQQTSKTSVTEFCYKIVNLFLQELINVNVKLFLIHELFRWQNSPK